MPIIALISLISLVGALIYKIYALNTLGVVLSLIIAGGLWFWFYGRKLNKISLKINLKLKKAEILGLFSYFALYLLALYTLYTHSSDRPLITPWQVVPSYFFIIYLVLTLILIYLIKNKKNLGLFLLSLHYFLSFIIAVIIYKIGYGYDPFIHQATTELIDKQGAVDPKPWYYLGQYSLIIIFHKITTVPIVWLDKLLVPVLAAATLPYIFSKFLKQNLWPVLMILILPFSLFILTTPQNLAYIFLIITIFSSLANSKTAILPALTTLFIHPLAGIPAIFIVLASFIKTKKKYLYPILFIISALALPLALLSSGSFKWQKIIWPFNQLIIPGSEKIFLNLTYAYNFSLWLIIIILISLGTYLFYKKYPTPALIGGALIASYLLSTQISFNLINYEQGDFANRILLLVVIIMLPYLLLLLTEFKNKLNKQNNFVKIAWNIFFALLITTSLYLSYPRFDNYHNSRGYATSIFDKQAVELIEKESSDKYIVLANQQTSAMALRTLGFNRYYNNLYFYPIPTSGPLYQYYLDMVYKNPSRDTMIKAMDLAGVNEGYFILNKYWWAFQKVLDEAKLSANSWKSINNGEIYIFKYNR